MPGIFEDPDESKYEEEWLVVMNTKAEYTLSKIQAQVLKQAIATGERGIVMFQTFAISIPYIAEFYQVRRFLKGAFQLPARASEKPYEPVSPEKWEEFKKKVYQNLGKSK